MTSPHTTVLSGGTWLQGLPLQSCTHFLALHVKLHAPERHCCSQYSTSLAHTIWQFLHFWIQFLAEHVRVLHRWPGHSWVQMEGLKYLFVKPHLHNTSLHFCVVFDSMTSCFFIKDAATFASKKNLMPRTMNQRLKYLCILSPIKRERKIKETTLNMESSPYSLVKMILMPGLKLDQRRCHKVTQGESLRWPASITPPPSPPEPPQSLKLKWDSWLFFCMNSLSLHSHYICLKLAQL